MFLFVFKYFHQPEFDTWRQQVTKQRLTVVYLKTSHKESKIQMLTTAGSSLRRLSLRTITGSDTSSTLVT